MITSILSNDVTYALAWTLVHSIWQFGLVAILLALISKILKNTKSIQRYYIGLGALSLCLLMALITFALYYTSSQTGKANYSEAFFISVMPSSNANALNVSSIAAFIDKYLMAIVNAWIIGSLLFFLKFSAAYIYLKKLVKKATSVDKPILKQLKRIKSKFNIHRNINIKESIAISTPMVIGYIKPVVLFPLGMINSLTTDEVNAILAHELAHIKRHDYLINLFQMILEVVFYYNPGIWYISSKVRMERENCCDDMAVSYTKNQITYARTLVKLQEMKMKNIEPAMAFAGGKNSFSKRVLRLLNNGKTSPAYKDKVLVALLLFVSLFLGAKNYHTEEAKESKKFDVYVIDDCPQAPEDIKYYLDTIPERNTFHIKKKTDKKQVEMEMKDGEITNLKIDGKEIPEDEISEHEDLINELMPSGERDIITLFPECGKDFGKVYLLERLSRNAVNMDSLLESLSIDERFNSEWENANLFDFRFEDYDDIMIDTIQDKMMWYKMAEKDLQHFKSNNFVDSIWDLIPHSLPDLYKDFGLKKEKLDEFLSQNEDNILYFDGNWNDINKNSYPLLEVYEKNFPQLEKDLQESLRSWKKNSEDIIRQFEQQRGRDNDSYQEGFFGDQEHGIFEGDNQNFPLKTYNRNWDEALENFDKKNLLKLEEFPFDFYQNKFKENDLFKSKLKISDIITEQLLSDGLIEDSGNTSVELTGKNMKINGEKQPKNIWRKYKKLYEESTGLELTKGSKIKLNISDSIKTKSNSKSMFGI